MPEPAPPRPVTYDEYLRTPEGGIYNLVDGWLLHEPSPGEWHQTVTGNLHALLRTHVRSRGLGRVYVAPLDVHLAPDQVYEPDVLYVSNERLGHMRERGLFGVAPDLAVEVLSPYTSRYDRQGKRRGYERHGCREYWLVDPRERTVEQWVRGEGGRLAPAGVHRGRFTSAVLPGLVATPEDVFAR